MKVTTIKTTTRTVTLSGEKIVTTEETLTDSEPEELERLARATKIWNDSILAFEETIRKMRL